MLPVLFLLLQDAAVPGELRRQATPYSIGIEWDLSGDADHDATCAVEYRAEGKATWSAAMPLFRVDFRGWWGDEKADRHYSMLAGSILFLQPGTAYEVKLSLQDPDGGSTAKVQSIRTRPEPSLPKGGRTLHVVPGAGGGAGTAENPFKGLAAARSDARPGDLFLLHQGRYGPFQLNKSGEAGRPIAWKGAGDGEAVLDSAELQASHVWIEGLTFRKAERTVGLKANGPSAEHVYLRNTFTGFHYAIQLNAAARDFFIADNVILGDQDPMTGGLDGEGVELAHSGGHVVAHNRISRVADGVSYPSRDCDIFGNDIFDVSDDGLEFDFGYANLRAWGNRLMNCKNAGLSFQPMNSGPWYFIRNQMVCRGEPLKLRVQDRFLLANNTIVGWDSTSSYAHHLLTACSRNNLFISAAGRRPVWIAGDTKDRRTTLEPAYARSWKTDVDYDGFDWGNAPEAFRWDNGARRFYDMAGLVKGVGIETHGRRVKKEEIFESWKIPAQEALVPVYDLTLRKDSAAIDAGQELPNITGPRPDLGAHEYGAPPFPYGPRK